MGYIDKNLIGGERVAYRTKIHWIVYTGAIVLLAVSLLIFFSGVRGFVYAGSLVLLGAAIWGIRAFIRVSTSEFAVTNKRVLIKIGLFRRHSLELLLQKVEGIGVDQGLTGRLFGFGSIVVTGTGGTKEMFHIIESPLEFRRKVEEQISITSAPH